MCTVDGTVNTNVAGTYTLEYYGEDGLGNNETVWVNVLVLSEYYQSAAGLYGTDLFNALRTLMNSKTLYNYDFAKTALAQTDKDPNNPNNLILMYGGQSVSGAWDAGVTWNREHVWPQSLLGTGDSTPIGPATDLHNLKPEDPVTNSTRGNQYFSNTGEGGYTPRDEVKGDIARILFYMELTYSNLTLIDGVPTTYQMADLSTLIEWNALDPVDAFEANRNQVIFGYQGNRNPFIDYPLLYRMIHDVSVAP